ncbi:MAG: putative metal-binding motif-containing protein [Patescibacteria group bacterium]
MKRSILTLALMGLVSSAFAASPHPTAIDADKDGAFAATVDVNADGKKDAADIGVRSSAYDCDDGHATVSPRLTEVVGDGIDNDCSGADAVYPVADPVAARYLKNSGAKNPLAFIAEYDRCKAAAAQCELDDVAGTMVIKDSASETHVFRDIFLGTSKTLGSDGIREVVTIDDASHFRGGSSSSGYTGPSKATREKEALAVATPLVTAESEARLSADARHDASLAAIQADNDLRDGVINDHGRSIESLESGLAAEHDALVLEAATRADADRRIEDKADAAQGDATSAIGAAYTAQDDALDAQLAAFAAASHGPLFEGYVAGNVMAGEPVGDNGEIARNAVFGGGGAGVNVGVDGEGFRANAFGETAFGFDGADGVSSNWAAGGEYLWQIDDSPVHLGLNAGYAQRSSLVNALETQVLGRMPMVGGTLAVPIGQGDSGQHGLFLVRADVGPEFIGMAGDDVTDAVRFGGRVTVGFGFGFGALR